MENREVKVSDIRNEQPRGWESAEAATAEKGSISSIPKQICFYNHTPLYF